MGEGRGGVGGGGELEPKPDEAISIPTWTCPRSLQTINFQLPTKKQHRRRHRRRHHHRRRRRH